VSSIFFWCSNSFKSVLINTENRAAAVFMAERRFNIAQLPIFRVKSSNCCWRPGSDKKSFTLIFLSSPRCCREALNGVVVDDDIPPEIRHGNSYRNVAEKGF
jgi:hypothetical protein